MQKCIIVDNKILRCLIKAFFIGLGCVQRHRRCKSRLCELSVPNRPGNQSEASLYITKKPTAKPLRKAPLILTSRWKKIVWWWVAQSSGICLFRQSRAVFKKKKKLCEVKKKREKIHLYYIWCDVCLYELELVFRFKPPDVTQMKMFQGNVL